MNTLLNDMSSFLPAIVWVLAVLGLLVCLIFWRRFDYKHQKLVKVDKMAPRALVQKATWLFIAWVATAGFLAGSLLGLLTNQFPGWQWRMISMTTLVGATLAGFLHALIVCHYKYGLWKKPDQKADKELEKKINRLFDWTTMSMAVVLFTGALIWFVQTYFSWHLLWQISTTVLLATIVMLIIVIIAISIGHRRDKTVQAAKAKRREEELLKIITDAEEEDRRMRIEQDNARQANKMGIQPSQLADIPKLEYVFLGPDGTFRYFTVPGFQQLRFPPEDAPTAWLIRKGEEIIGGRGLFDWTVQSYGYEITIYDSHMGRIRIEREDANECLAVALALMSEFHTVWDCAYSCRDAAAIRALQFRRDMSDDEKFERALWVKKLMKAPINDVVKMLEASDQPDLSFGNYNP